MAVSIRTGSDPHTLQAESPVPLFATRMVGADGQPADHERTQYIVSADGQRFLMNALTIVPASPIYVILNWKPRDHN